MLLSSGNKHDHSVIFLKKTGFMDGLLLHSRNALKRGKFMPCYQTALSMLCCRCMKPSARYSNRLKTHSLPQFTYTSDSLNRAALHLNDFGCTRLLKTNIYLNLGCSMTTFGSVSNEMDYTKSCCSAGGID